MPTEKSFLVPLEYIDVTRTTFTTLDAMLETHIDDYWNVDGVSDAWTGLTRFYISDTGWIYMVREEIDKKTNDIKARQNYG